MRMVEFEQSEANHVTTNITHSDSSFNSRQKNLENLLDAVEKEYSKNANSNTIHHKQSSERSEWAKRKQQFDTSHYKKEESIFLKPDVPPIRIQCKATAPDFKLHPHRWMKYTLNDVSADDMSDASNTNTALSFLKELESRKEEGTKVDVDMEDKKPMFRKRMSSQSKIEGCSSIKRSFKGNVLIMPEYEVGRGKITKKKSNLSSTANLSIPNISGIKLNHLLEPHEED